MSVSRDDQWDKCPTGTIRSMVNHQNVEQRRQFLKVAGGVSTLVVLVGVGAGYGIIARRARGIHVGGIWCSEVVDSMGPFLMGTLDVAISSKIEIHLAHCPQCKEKVDKMKSQPRNVAVG